MQIIFYKNIADFEIFLVKTKKHVFKRGGGRGSKIDQNYPREKFTYEYKKKPSRNC